MTTALNEILEIVDFGIQDDGLLYVEVEGILGNSPWDPQDYRESRVTASRTINLLDYDEDPAHATEADIRALIATDDNWDVDSSD